MKKHFVTFESPGTFVHESTTKPIGSWDVAAAVETARGIHERHGATPFAFYFATRTRRDDDLDSKITATSGRYFLGGRVETIEEVDARNDPSEKILRANMHGNNIERIVVNDNSWKSTQPLGENDVVLDFTP